MATRSRGSSTTQTRPGSRRGSLQMRHRSPSATFQQTRQKCTRALTSVMARARRSASAGSTLRMWKACRWALFGPISGSRPSSSIRSWTGPSYIASEDQAGWQPHALGDAAQALSGQVLGLAQALVDGGGDQVAEHLDVVGVERVRVDRHRLHRLVALDPGRDHAAAGRPLDDLLGQLGLGVLHLPLHLLQLLEHLVGVEPAAASWHAHCYRPFLAPRAPPLAAESFGRSSMTFPPSSLAAQSATARASASASSGRPSSLAGSTSNSTTWSAAGAEASAGGGSGSSGPVCSPTTTWISRPPPSIASSTPSTWRPRPASASASKRRSRGSSTTSWRPSRATGRPWPRKLAVTRLAAWTRSSTSGQDRRTRSRSTGTRAGASAGPQPASSGGGAAAAGGAVDSRSRPFPRRATPPVEAPSTGGCGSGSPAGRAAVPVVAAAAFFADGSAAAGLTAGATTA